MRNKAFTLAETLTTLLLIGVVAVLTIPALSTQISDYTLDKHRKAFSKKFEDGLKQMQIDGMLVKKYSSTEDFVSVMQNYFNLVQVCDKNNLQKCFSNKFTATWSYESSDKTAKDSGSKSVDLSTVSTTNTLSKSVSYNTNVMGLKFIDGVNMLITYNPNCTGAMPLDINANLTECFGYVYDVNSSKSPNVEGKDIETNMLIANKFNLGFAIIDDKVWSRSDSGTVQGPYWSNDYWLAAKQFCEEKGGRLPSKAELTQISNVIYRSEYKKADGSYDSDKIRANPMYKYLLGTIDTINLWSSQAVNDGYAVFLQLNTTQAKFYQTCGGQGRSCSYSTYKFICIR